jgi:hypothetical protein
MGYNAYEIFNAPKMGFDVLWTYRFIFIFIIFIVFDAFKYGIERVETLYSAYCPSLSSYEIFCFTIRA